MKTLTIKTKLGEITATEETLLNIAHMAFTASLEEKSTFNLYRSVYYEIEKELEKTGYMDNV